MRRRLRRRARSPAAAAYEGTALPSTSTPWRGASYAVVDLETTGLDPREDEIISFASLPIDDARVIAREARTLTIRPRRMPEAQTIRIHGLRPLDLVEAPELPDVLDVVLEALTGRILVAHAAWVERGFLSAAFGLAGVRLQVPVLDTEALVRSAMDSEVFAADRAVALSDAAASVGLPVHHPHTAEGDALTTAQLFLALASRLDRVEPQTVGSLARISKRSS